MKKIQYFLFIIATFVFTACTGAASAPVKTQEPLKIGWALYSGWYPIVIAQEQDFFEKHDVIVEPVFFEPYSASFSDLEAGKLDGALFTLSDALLMDSRRPDSLKVVLVTDNSAGVDAIVATGDIETVADLKGKRVGGMLDTFSELLIHNMLQNNGLTANDISLVNINPEEVPAAIPDKIEAGYVWGPYISEVEANGGHVLFSSADAPGLIPDLLVMRTEVTQTRPDDIRAFNAAWFEAVEWWQTHPEQGNAIIAEATGLKPEEVSSEGVYLFDLEDNLEAFEPGEDTTSLYFSGQLTTDFLISTGGLGNVPDIERLLDSSFLE